MSLGEAVAFLAWAFWTLVVAMFFVSHGDEGSYHPAAVLIAEGRKPILDFFIVQGVWTYLPYAALAGLVSTYVESLRLFSVLSVVAVAAMVSLTVRRRCGPRWGMLAFALIAGSWPWYVNNLEIRHSAPANLGLVAAYFCLFHLPSGHRWPAFLSGVFLGIAVNARVVLAPMAIVFAVLLLALRPEGQDKAEAGRRLALAFLGGLLASLPNLAILIADHEAFLFDYLFALLEANPREPHPDWGTAAVWFVQTRGEALAGFLTGFHRTDGGFPNLVLLLPLAVAIALAGTRPTLASREVRAALAVSLGIVGCYIIHLARPVYFHHVIPFLAVAGPVALHQACLARGEKLPAWGRGVLAAGLAVSLSTFAAYSAADVIRRAEPSSSRPMTSSKVACWLERNTLPDATIMTYEGGSVASSGRRLPKGFEAAFGGIGLLQFLPPERAHRYRSVTWDELAEQIRSGAFPVVVDDYYADRILGVGRGIDTKALLEPHYRPFARSGGAYYLDIWVNKAIDPAALTPFPPTRTQRLDIAEVAARMRAGDYAGLARAAWLDVAESLVRLPGDLGAALSRAFGGRYEDRCGRLLGME